MAGLVEVARGARFRVLMLPAVAKDFAKVDIRQRTRCLKWMKFFADEGDDHLDPGKLRHEGRFPLGVRGGTTIPVLAFKAWQVRVYGGVVGGCFVATEIDPGKKQDAADQDMLRRAARKLADFVQRPELLEEIDHDFRA